MQVVCGSASALTEFRIELREARQSPSLPWVRPRQLRNFRNNVVAEAMVPRSEDEAINENSGGVGPFRGLPALPKGRGKAALRSDYDSYDETESQPREQAGASGNMPVLASR